MTESDRSPHVIVRDFRTRLSSRLDRRLYCHIRRCLQHPDDLDALAQRTLEMLQAQPWPRLQRCPLRCVHVAAVRAFTELPSPCADPTEAAMFDPCHMAARLRYVLLTLPTTHMAVVMAYQNDAWSHDDIARLVDIPAPLVDLYDSQARALIRVAPWGPETAMTDGDRDPHAGVLLVAQSAADWLDRLGQADALELNEFAQWLLVSPRHVRELLLSAAWDLVLLEYTQWMRAHDGAVRIRLLNEPDESSSGVH